MDAAMYNDSSHSACDTVRRAVEFSLGSVPEPDLLSLYSTQHIQNNGKASEITLLAHIAKVQARAHAHLTREVINKFYTNCRTDCVLNPTQDPTSAGVSKYAGQFLDANKHKTSALFERAWLATCRVFRSRANDGALNTLQDIADKRLLAVLPQVWQNAPDLNAANCVEISIGAYAYVVLKVRFDLCLPSNLYFKSLT